MKLSVSLPTDDVAFLDEYARAQGMSSRSAVVHMAVERLREEDLADSYEDAWKAWNESKAARDWEATASDGIEP